MTGPQFTDPPSSGSPSSSLGTVTGVTYPMDAQRHSASRNAVWFSDAFKRLTERTDLIGIADRL